MALPTTGQAYASGRTVAVLDIGSNSCRLVIAVLSPRTGFQIIEEARALVRLAPPRRSQAIGASAMRRARQAFTAFRFIAESHQPDEFVYLATAAVRQSSNRDAVVTAFSDWLGRPVRVASAEEESRYAVVAAANSFSEPSGTVVDLGGGSMQIASYQGMDMLRADSLPAGALLLHQDFISSDPPRGKQLQKLRSHLSNLFAEVPDHVERPVLFVGGTARAIAKLHQRSFGYRLPWAHGYHLTLKQLTRLTAQLASLSVAERVQLPGMSADRADIILAGALSIEEFCKAASVEHLVISGEGVRHGVLYQRLSEAGMLEGDARGRTVEQLAAVAGEVPYQEAVDSCAGLLVQAPPAADPLVRELLPIAARLHRLGDVVSLQRSSRSAEHIVLSREMPGFSHREWMLLASALGSQGRLRLRAADCGPPLHATDVGLVDQVSTLLDLAVELGRTGSTQVAVEAVDAGLAITCTPVPFVAESLSARYRSAFSADLTFVEPAG
ncbi:MAG: hypothetical protein GEU28_00895 [Dehalococcoidia bacterium]|nr:hypothetical protein [Dehalococcoidia bacterium]